MCFLVSLALAHRFYPSLFFFLGQTHLSFIAEYEYNQITKLPWLVDGGGESSNQIISSKSIEWATRFTLRLTKPTVYHPSP